MSSKILLAIPVIAILSLPGGKTAPAQEAKKRDMSQYAQGGEFRIHYAAPEEEEEEMEAGARKCVWDNWRQKRMARCAVVRSSIEGDPTTSHFYVEPDDGGRWRVALEVEFDCCWFYAMEGKERKREVKGGGFYYVVERLDANDGGALPVKKERQPRSYRLVLKRDKTKEGDDAAAPAFTL